MNPKPRGTIPSVILCNPRYAHNVGGAFRACSCYDIDQLWWTGDRVRLDNRPGQRLPREERMKGYKSVSFFPNEDIRKILEEFPNAVPVAVEVRPNSELLPFFEHPENAVYIFGPEDGSVAPGLLPYCHRFLAVPTAHCLNLSAAVATVLYDRRMKRMLAGLEPGWRLDDFLNESRGYFDLGSEQGSGVEGLTGVETGS